MLSGTVSTDIVATAPEAVTYESEGALGTVDWGNPLRHTVSLPSMEAAAAELQFAPVGPGQLGPPAAIQVSDGSIVIPEDRALVLIYDHPSLGLFYVKESKLDLRAEEAQQMLEDSVGPDACPERHECPVTKSLVTLEQGHRVALTLAEEGPDAFSNFVTLVDPTRGLLVDIVGPYDTFSGTEAVAAANALMRSG
jgi:hypothetical protein